MSYVYWNNELEQRRLAKIAAIEHEEMTKMATVSMTYNEALTKVKGMVDNPKAFIDALKALGLLRIMEERMVIDVTDKALVIIKRNGEEIYRD